MTNHENMPAPKGRRRFNWSHISTVVSAGVLIGTEVFGIAYAGGWALGQLLALDYYLGSYATRLLQVILCGGGLYMMARFFIVAFPVEPISTREIERPVNQRRT